MRFLLSFARRLSGNQEGVTAVEFALISPVVLVLMFGALEVSNLLIADTKLRAATAGVSDLITQKSDGEITTANLQMANFAARLIMAPLPFSDGGSPRMAIMVTNYNTNSAGETTVAWTRVLNPTSPATPTLSPVLGLSPPPCGPATLPAGLATARNQVIEVRGVYVWRPLFSFLFNADVNLNGRNYSMPRFSVTLNANFGSGAENCPAT